MKKVVALMNWSLEQEDIQAISEAIFKKLMPFINVTHEGEDVVFNKKGLSEYLKVSESTINKLVSNKRIPHFKINHGQSGGVRFYKRDIDKWIARHTIPEMNEITVKLRKVA